MLEKERLSVLLNTRLNLGLSSARLRSYMKKWEDLVDKQDNLRHNVSIALVGKYTELTDAYASVIKALDHAALACERRLKLVCVEAEDLEEQVKSSDPVKYYEAWQNVCKSDGILVPGGFGRRGMEGKVSVCNWARIHNRPFLGICLGLQAAVIEFCRNVLNWENSTSQEIDNEEGNNTKNLDGGKSNLKRHVIVEMPEHNPGNMGGTMRLGVKKTIFTTENSVIRKLYGNTDCVMERHRHRFEVNPEYVPAMQERGLKFVGEDSKHERMEIIELEDHPYYVACQFHPEYLTR